MDEELKKLRDLSDKAFEVGDYTTLREIRAKILDYNKAHSTTKPRIEDQLKQFSVKDLKGFQKKTMTAENNFDIWLATLIEDEINRRYEKDSQQMLAYLARGF